MDHNGRLNCQVRLRDQGGSPVGCGFICDDRHVMTCTHVVASCLNGPVDRGIVECAFPGEKYHRAKLRVIKSVPTNADARDQQANLLRDIAVLELEPGSTFPANFQSVSSILASLDQHMEFRGTGIMTGFLEGIQIGGKTGEYGETSRVFVAGYHPDQMTQPGCSGAAVFHGHQGLLGMVTEVQQDATGLIVPIEVLRKFWPIRGATESALAGPTAEAAITRTAEPLNKRMLRTFSDFDRVDQSADFRNAFDRNWNQNRSAMLCAISGLKEDVPLHCRDKFKNSDLKEFLRRNNIAASKIDALEISWPHDRRRFDVKDALARMKGVLAVHLRAPETTPRQIRETLNTDLRQLIFFSKLDQRTFGKDHLELLHNWAAYFCEIDDEPIDRPLIHFLIIQLNPTGFRPGSLAPNALLARFYRDLIARTNRKMPAGSEIESTQLLNYFDIDFLDNWIATNAETVGLDEQLAEEVRESARA